MGIFSVVLRWFLQRVWLNHYEWTCSKKKKKKKVVHCDSASFDQKHSRSNTALRVQFKVTSLLLKPSIQTLETVLAGVNTQIQICKVVTWGGTVTPPPPRLTDPLDISWCGSSTPRDRRWQLKVCLCVLKEEGERCSFIVPLINHIYSVSLPRFSPHKYPSCFFFIFHTD